MVLHKDHITVMDSVLEIPKTDAVIRLKRIEDPGDALHIKCMLTQT